MVSLYTWPCDGRDRPPSSAPAGGRWGVCIRGCGSPGLELHSVLGGDVKGGARPAHMRRRAKAAGGDAHSCCSENNAARVAALGRAGLVWDGLSKTRHSQWAWPPEPSPDCPRAPKERTLTYSQIPALGPQLLKGRPWTRHSAWNMVCT